MQRPDIHDRVEAQRLEREAHGRIRVRRSVVRRDGVGCEVDAAYHDHAGTVHAAITDLPVVAA